MGSKVFSALMIVMMLFPTVAPWVMTPLVAQSKNQVSTPNESTAGTRGSTNVQSIVLSIGNINLTVIIKEPARKVLMLYQADGWTRIEEIVVTPVANGYDTEMYMNGALVDHRVRDLNLLEPVDLASTKPSAAIASIDRPPVIQASYTHEWWDGLYYVNGPSWQVKYPHPDRDYYQIPIFNPWTGFGTKVIHNQLDQAASRPLAGLGWLIIFTVVGVYIGAMIGGACGTAIGAVCGVVFGIVFTITAQRLLLDEQDCLWWFTSRAFANWLLANAWLIWWLSLIPGGANAFVTYGLSLYGYIRIGGSTFLDAVGAGNP